MRPATHPAGGVQRANRAREERDRDHFEYLKESAAKGVLELAGPCLDGTFGLCLFVAQSLEAAQAVVAADPVVQRGVMSAELHPFRVSVRGPQHP